MVQIFTGLLLVLYYTPSSEEAFSTIDYLLREVNNGWLIRLLHSSGASLFIGLLYLHAFKGLYFGGFRLLGVWIRGIFLIFLSIVTAFFGYVLV